MIVDERAQLTHQLGVAAGVEVLLDPPLEAGQTQLFEAGDLALGEPLVGELGERRTTPERQRFFQPPVLDQPLKTHDVELVIRDVHQSSRAPWSARGPSDRLAQLRDVDLEGLLRSPRRLVLPERFDQALGGDDLVGVHQKHRQQRPVLGARELDRSLFLDHLERAENPELHLHLVQSLTRL